MSESKETISVVVICRDARPFIGECIKSIRAQTRAADEIIVVDGQSSDGTWAWLQEQADLRVIRQPDQGIANARNLGIKQSRGEFIAFLDADDTWPADKLALQLQDLRSVPECEAITGQLIKTGDDTTFLAMTPGGFLFRRAVFNRYGLFDTRWQIASEHEWFLRTRRLGMATRSLPTVVLYKTMHGGNLSITHKKQYREEVMAVLKEHHGEITALAGKFS